MLRPSGPPADGPRRTVLTGVLIAASSLACCGGEPDPSPAPPAEPPAIVDTSHAVQVGMRHVAFAVDSGVVLEISRLSGALLPASDTEPATFDHRTSFTLRIDGAQIAIDTASLSNLLTRHVFAYKGSPLGNLRVSIEAGQLVQKGTLKKGIHLPFTVKADVSLTPAGMIRLHPTSIKVIGIGAAGLLKFFGTNLESLTRIKPGHGVTIEGNDFLIDPTAILPPPRVTGRVTALSVGKDRLIQTFGGAADATPLAPPDTTIRNYMYFRRGRLRFGKLTMADADMLIVDLDPKDPFDFFLARYRDQLVAGYHETTRTDGLIVYMPDRNDLRSGAARPKARP